MQLHTFRSYFNGLKNRSDFCGTRNTNFTKLKQPGVKKAVIKLNIDLKSTKT